MKKIIFISIFSALVCLVQIVFIHSSVYSQTITPDIKEQLITNIASRVAQLKLVEKRGIIGRVTDVANIQIIVTDLQNNTRFVDVDELTKFSSPKAKETYGISDITKGTSVGILGLYNKESRRILARFVNEITTPRVIHGGVEAVDNENFSINVITDDDKQMTVDIENLTRTYSYTQDSGYLRSGFSKIKENYNIIVVGMLDTKDDKRMTATRVIFFPEIPARVSK